MRGNITRRGKASWRLKFEIDADSEGNRQTRFVTVRGRRADAERELTRLLTSTDSGTFVERSSVTITEYLRAWLAGEHGLSPKTAERYRELAEGQVIPHLGAVPLQKLRPARIEEWHAALLRCGGRGGRRLSARTVGHAHRLLHRALERAVGREDLVRNVAGAVSPPKLEPRDMRILDAAEVPVVLHKLEGNRLHPIVSLALATGMRRGELLALRLEDVDLEAAALRVERSLEETNDGLRFKGPKTKHGKRTISLPATAVTVLREHRVKLLEQRLLLGLGRPEPDALLFGELDGAPRSPANLTAAWRWACKSLRLPLVSFHALRHTHASSLIAAGVDIVTVSRRLGHANPTITLNVYAHLFADTDASAATAIEKILGTGGGR